jgi:hypothetical protein
VRGKRRMKRLGRVAGRRMSGKNAEEGMEQE